MDGGNMAMNAGGTQVMNSYRPVVWRGEQVGNYEPEPAPV